MYDASHLTAFTEEDIISVLDDAVLLGMGRYHACKIPKAVLLAGQPGAGKTRLSSMVTQTLGGDAVLINGDDFRRYHPNYQKLFEQYGANAAGMVSSFSNTVVERMIEEFSNRHFNLVVEGTGRTVEVPHSTAELLSGKGYTVELAVIAARPEMSLISTLLRFYQMNERGTIPRATAVSAHDAVVDALPRNLDILWRESKISRITIWDREQQLLYSSGSDHSTPSAILREYWDREWSAEEQEMAQAQIDRLYEMELREQLGQTALIQEAERRVAAVVQREEPFQGIELKF